MEKSRILDYWLDFFRDLLLGTLKNLFIFSLIGLGLGVSTIIIFNSQVLDVADWSNSVKTLILFMVSIWYLGFGILHGWVACVLKVMIQKIREALEGLQQLLDWITREVFDRIPKFQKMLPRSELEKKYDQVGIELLATLKQKGGLIGFFSGFLFSAILKAIKFFFLDQVVEEIQKKDTGEVTSTDIEHAVRRVGTEVMISPITDNLFLIHILNITLGFLFFGLPFGLLWLL